MTKSIVLGAFAFSLVACSSGGAATLDAAPFGDSGHLIVTPPPRDAGADVPRTNPHDASADRAMTPVDARDAAVDGKGDADADEAASDAPFTPATHTYETIPANGGPVLAHPMLVTVTYANDPERGFVEGLGSYLVTSPWLSMVGAEYGVGLGTAVNVELPGSAPTSIDDVGIQALVATLVDEGTAPESDASVTVTELPPENDGGFGEAGPADAGPDALPYWDGGGDGGPPLPLPETIYMMYFPNTTRITAEGEAICSFSGGGYHSQTSLSSRGKAFAYGVITECPMSTQDDLVQAASHEFIEASTDPGSIDRAYAIENLYDPWSYFGGEVGDLCALISPEWAEGGYTGIQRVYSDKSAAAGGDPCLPSLEPWFGTSISPSTAVAVTPGNATVFEVSGWSSAATSDWYMDGEPYVSYPTTFQPTFTLTNTNMNNGGKSTLTVGVPAGTPSGSFALGLLYSAHDQSDFTTTLVEVYVP